MKLLATLALLLVVVPTASAGLFTHDPVTVTVGVLHVGDTLRYDSRTMQYTSRDGQLNAGKVVNETRVVKVLGTSSAFDKFGIERATDDYREDTYLDGNLTVAQVCHGLQGGVDSVAFEPLVGGGHGHGGGSGVATVLGIPVQQTQTESNTTVIEYFSDTSCSAQTALAGRTLHEGDVLRLSDLFPLSSTDLVGDIVSSPATPREFHGRAALDLAWRLAPIDAFGLPAITYTVTVADGLPGTVARSSTFDGKPSTFDSTERLTAIDPGTGPALALPDGARLPTDSPTAKLAPFDKLRFDDAGLGLAYPFADAYAALVADPQVPLKAFLDAHPDAVLSSATFGAYALTEGAPGTRPDGTWMLVYTSGNDGFVAFSSRSSTASPNPAVPSQHLPPYDQGQTQEIKRPYPIRTLPPAVADGATLARLASTGGVKPGAITTLSYGLAAAGNQTFASVWLTDTPLPNGGDGETKSRAISIDARHGGLQSISTTRTTTKTSGLLAPPLGDGISARDESASRFSLLAGPAAGSGLAAVAGAAGIAGALLLIVKFLLVPLFTRLRRSTLLDNAVRARLYERVRAEPGIRQAELVDYAGLGRSPTLRHLDQLVRHGFLAALPSDGAVSYYATGEVPPEVARREALLRAGSHRAVYELYAREPTLSLREAGARLGMSAPSVYRAKAKLTKAGLLPAPAEADAPLVR